jgi:chorismate dehydratase
LLAAGQVDVALVPVIEYQRIPGLALVPDVCVGSRQEVRSVVLAARSHDLKSLRRIALDESSRTSAAMLKILFREFVGSEPEWQTSVPDIERMLKENDAALIIGDPGMTFPRGGLNVFDLASLWREYTGLGFVFAMWMLREDAISFARKIDFLAACQEGLERTAEIIDFYEERLGLSREELESYLKHNISFFLTDEMQEGLELYFSLAFKHGLIPGLKSLKTIEP